MFRVKGYIVTLEGQETRIAEVHYMLSFTSYVLW